MEIAVRPFLHCGPGRAGRGAAVWGLAHRGPRYVHLAGAGAAGKVKVSIFPSFPHEACVAPTDSVKGDGRPWPLFQPFGLGPAVLKQDSLLSRLLRQGVSKEDGGTGPVGTPGRGEPLA